MFLPVTQLHQTRRAAFQHGIEVRSLHRQPAAPAHAGGDFAVERRAQFRKLGMNFADRHVRAQQPHAAIDVVADSARRDDSILGIERGHAAYGKPVALVNVRHGQGVAHDARQRGHVDELLERAVRGDLVQHVVRGIDARGHAHVRAVAARNLPQPVVNFGQIRFREHEPSQPAWNRRGGPVCPPRGRHAGLPLQVKYRTPAWSRDSRPRSSGCRPRGRSPL